MPVGFLSFIYGKMNMFFEVHVVLMPPSALLMSSLDKKPFYFFDGDSGALWE
jgi:hypothetical protein